jgi:ribosomal protein S6--L-glutamate ligase
MNAAVISLGSTSSQMLIEAMKKYFDRVDAIQLRNIELSLGRGGTILYNGEPLPKYSCIYPKGSFRYAQLLHSLVSRLKGSTAYIPFSASAFTITHNKLLTHLVLQHHNIPMPMTYLSPNSDAARNVLKKVNYPIVMKFPEGTQGKGVMFADSFSSASSLLDALGVLNQPFIIQEYIETGNTDIRALVVGDRVIAAMKRTAQTEEKRANIHAGGTGEYYNLDRIGRRIAIDTAKALNADICGVDILEGPTGPQVIEANISPGLQGLSQVSQIDIADEIARFLYKKTTSIVKNTKEENLKEIMAEISPQNHLNDSNKIITNLVFRGERILLPEIVTKMSQFDESKEYAIKVSKGKLEIEEFKL